MTQRKRFSQAAPEEVYRAIGAKRLQSKEITAKQKPVSIFFEERLKRLQNFDLRSSERAKELLIDACLEEAIFDHPGLKIWKAAPLKDELFNGTADYLIAPKQDFLSTPLLCVVEAKKDDFDQGCLQCLAEMRACRWNNLQQKLQLDSGVLSPMQMSGVFMAGLWRSPGRARLSIPSTKSGAGYPFDADATVCG